MSERKIIIFLGAGASKADGAPLQAELLHKFFNEKNHKDKSIYASKYGSLYNTLEDFFKEFIFGNREIPNKKEEFPTCEEVFGLLHFFQLKNKTKSEPNSDSEDEYKKIEFCLILLIAKVLLEELNKQANKIKKLNKQANKIKKNELNHHQKFIKMLRENDYLTKVAFISTNYDLLLDNRLYDDNIDYLIDK